MHRLKIKEIHTIIQYTKARQLLFYVQYVSMYVWGHLLKCKMNEYN